MTQADLTKRIARSSSDAASGYAAAAMAAYADMAQQTMTFWAGAFDSMLPKPEPRSWYRPPAPAPKSPPAAMLGPFAWMAWPQVSNAWNTSASTPQTPFAMATMFNPFEFWARALPLQGTPAAWPMAFAMLGAGWPRNVAYPAAEANVAMLDAVQTTAKAVEQTFASYHSATGFASAQVKIASPQLALALTAPFGFTLLAPWLGA
ncbi:MAG: hypothetical protein KDJ37_11835 [Hyphomicrobiaceae bacterium]|nr:hypothetical protein [Hyphomicrobiaceae bacterium]